MLTCAVFILSTFGANGIISGSASETIGNTSCTEEDLYVKLTLKLSKIFVCLNC